MVLCLHEALVRTSSKFIMDIVQSQKKLGLFVEKICLKNRIIKKVVHVILKINLRESRMIFVIENCLWKSNFGRLCVPAGIMSSYTM